MNKTIFPGVKCHRFAQIKLLTQQLNTLSQVPGATVNPFSETALSSYAYAREKFTLKTVPKCDSSTKFLSAARQVEVVSSSNLASLYFHGLAVVMQIQAVVILHQNESIGPVQSDQCFLHGSFNNCLKNDLWSNRHLAHWCTLFKAINPHFTGAGKWYIEMGYPSFQRIYFFSYCRNFYGHVCYNGFCCPKNAPISRFWVQ